MKRSPPRPNKIRINDNDIYADASYFACVNGVLRFRTSGIQKEAMIFSSLANSVPLLIKGKQENKRFVVHTVKENSDRHFDIVYVSIDQKFRLEFTIDFKNHWYLVK